MATAFALPPEPGMRLEASSRAKHRISQSLELPGPFRLTADQFLHYEAQGLFEDRKVELVAGELWEEPLHGMRHGQLQGLIAALLHGASPPAAIVVGELSVRFSDWTVRDIDAGLTRAGIGDVPAVSPTDVVLAVEISVTTLAVDLNVKAIEYAQAGIPHYWVIDAEAEAVHVMSGPGPEGYAERRIVRFSEPLTVPGGGEIVIAPPAA